MTLLVSMLQIYMPEYVKKRALMQLFNAAAASFEAEVPPIAGLDYKECLEKYALFTQTLAEQHLRSERNDARSQIVLDAKPSRIATHFAGCERASEVEAVEQRLYRNAAELGQLSRRLLRLGTVQDVMAIARVLYRILDIDFQGDARGEVVINSCYFSRFYSSQVCRLMSAMDRGLLAGLSNGGELTFTSRITEGQPCCHAHFNWEPKVANYPDVRT